MGSLNLVTAPTVNPVTDAEVWDFLRVPLTGSPAVPADQSLIDGLIAAAVGELDGREGVLGRCLVEQTWAQTLDGFPVGGCAIPLPLAPVRSISSITYTDPDGAAQTLSTDVYRLSAETDWRPQVELKYQQSWPSTRDDDDVVTVTFVAGYDPSAASPPDYRANVPDELKIAIMLKVQAMYDRDDRNRDTLEKAAAGLYRRFKRTWL